MEPSGKLDQMCYIYSHANKHISNSVCYCNKVALPLKWEPCHLVSILGIASQIILQHRLNLISSYFRVAVYYNYL